MATNDTESGVEWQKSYARVVLFGDSITQFGFSSDGGWCASVADRLQRKVDIINRGFSGYNTQWAKIILPELVNHDNCPDFIVLFFGANDAASNALQHIPLEEYKSNLSDMCAYLNSVGVPNSSILLVTPPPVCDRVWEEICIAMGFTGGDRTFATAEKYAQGVIEVGQKRGVAVANVFNEISKRDNLEDYFIDGLHLGERGNDVMAELVIDILEERFKGQLVVFPEWEKFDVASVQKRLNSKI